MNGVILLGVGASSSIFFALINEHRSGNPITDKLLGHRVLNLEHFASPGALFDVVIVVRNQTIVKNFCNYFVLRFQQQRLTRRSTRTQAMKPPAPVS